MPSRARDTTSLTTKQTSYLNRSMWDIAHLVPAHMGGAGGAGAGREQVDVMDLRTSQPSLGPVWRDGVGGLTIND